MMNEVGLRRILPDQSSGSGHTYGTLRHPSVIDPILSKRVCFYKSGDPQFNGLRLVINNRTFKTFDALLDSLSKKVPLPFGVRNITTPHGVHTVNTLDELEDGKSYICSDSRKVKPINLALARKKLPPWYHARPVSSRRRTVQQARFFPGRNIHKPEAMAVRTPKRLLVYRNGDPTVKRTVMLHKKNTSHYESILEYISELMQFHVVKLHTPDGKRVDGLPGLILCSGVVVAVGREPFRPAIYNAQKSPPPAWLNKRRQKALNRKRKTPTHSSSKKRNFSPSSERYIIRQIHNTIAESSCDIASNPTNSIEWESNRILESVAETEDDAGEQECSLPNEDDIEKSFRVNQDGSMTVEMKVRLTIKEEETIHWTTTLSRSSVASQLDAACLPDPEQEELTCSPIPNSMDFQSSAASITDNIFKNKSKDNNDEDPPSPSNGAFSENIDKEKEFKTHSDTMFSRRVPTPGNKQISKKQASVESIKSVRGDGIQEEMVGSYSYREQTENGTMTEQYCMVKQSSTRPVPKPRRLGSVDNSRNVSEFKSVGMSEMLQIESSGEEVTETVLHIYEQQTCQDNYLANVCSHSTTFSGVTLGRPATSETGVHPCNVEYEPEHCRPSTASESVSIWRAESISVTSDLNSASPQMHANEATNSRPKLLKHTNGQGRLQQREDLKGRKGSPKHKVINKRLRRLKTPGKAQKENPAEAAETHKKAKPFSSAGYIKRIYGTKSKFTKKLKKKPTQNENGSFTADSISDDARKGFVNIPSASKDSSNGVPSEKNRMSLSSAEVSPPRGILTRQPSMHKERKTEKKACDINESMPLPVFNSSSSVINEYVENWLEKAHLSQPTEGSRCGESENKQDSISEIEEVEFPEPPPENLLESSVKLRVQSFENKVSGPPLEKSTISQHNVHNLKATMNSNNSRSSNQNYTEETKPLLNGVCSEMIPPELPPVSEMENLSDSVKISFQKATPLNPLSMEQLPPPPAEITELSNTEYCMNDVSSAAINPFSGLSSSSTPRTDNHPLCVSPTSDKVISPIDNTMKIVSAVQADIRSGLNEAPLSRVPSIKKAPLVSNLSFERKMSLRKASLDKHTLSNDATLNLATLSTTINTTGEDVPSNDSSSTATQRPIKPSAEETQQSISDLMSIPSCCTSASPTSLTSDERVSSASIASSEVSVPRSLPSKDTKTTKTQFLSQKETSSPKPLVKKAKITTSPSPDRKSLNRKSSQEHPHNPSKLPPIYNRPSKTMTPDVGLQTLPTPNANSTERKQKLYKPKWQKRPSPYSQSLDVVSVPVRHRPSRKMLSRNISLDNSPQPTIKTQRKTSLPQKTPGSVNSANGLSKPLMSDPLTSPGAERKDSKVNQERVDQVKSKTFMQTTSQPLNTMNQLNMKPVLDKICYSIKSIRQVTQNKRPSCLEKSNSLPDFSSHVASTFGSSSKALLAFLAVMTLKEGLTNQNMNELHANNVSCAEALKMIDSLREIANIEDSHQLNTSLSNLQQSASKQLLQSWKGFQELGERCKSRNSTKSVDQGLNTAASPEPDCSFEESVIDELINSFDMPEEIKEELASISIGGNSDTEEQVSLKENREEDANPLKTPENDNNNVRTMIKKFTDITNPKQTEMETIYSRAKHKPEIWENKKTDIHQISEVPEEKQLYNTPLVQENVVLKETLDEQKHVNKKTLTQEKAGMKEDIRKSMLVEKGDTDCGQLQRESQKNINLHENELTQNMSSSEKEGQKTLSAEKDVSQMKTKQESSEDEVLSSPERPSEDDEDYQPSTSYYVELNARGKESMSCSDSENQDLSEEEQTEVEHKERCNSTEKEMQKSSMGQDVSIDESTDNSDVDESSSEEVEPEAESKHLQVIVEETSSGIEDEEEEEQLHVPLQNTEQTKKFNELEALIEETEEDSGSPENADTTNLIEKQHPLSKKDHSLAKNDQFTTEEDSGNDHSSCEEHVDEEQPKVEFEHISFSVEEECCYDKESSSEEERARMNRYIEDTVKQYQTTETQSDVRKGQIVVEKNIATQSVAERVVLLEKRVADSQKLTYPNRSASRRASQRHTPLESDEEESSSESPTSQLALCTRSAPQSSLSFSYDSSGVITTEPEGNRVRHIREMFLAKSATDVQLGRLPSQNASEPPDLGAETSVSGGYQSQISSEQSSGEDDSARKSITKGFVRRTIERLYGKKDAHSNVEAAEKPPTESKQKSKEQSSIFSSFQTARSKAISELSYLNSTGALDSLTEATRCIAFNAQVGPGDSVPIDDGRWLLRENTLIRKSVSDPVAINKTFANTPEVDEKHTDREEKTPYSLFSTKSEMEDKATPFVKKCTYFSLPHGSDSDACQDEVSMGSPNGDTVIEIKDNPGEIKSRTERNGMLPGVGDFKLMDNKVHPLTEPSASADVVVLQPGKGQGVVNRRLPEPDMLDFLYNFCGQNCPIL